MKLILIDVMVCFFKSPNKNYEDILKSIKDGIKRIDINALDGLVNEYESLLRTYQSKLDISDNRINKLVNGLNIRISKLNKHIMVLSC